MKFFLISLLICNSALIALDKSNKTDSLKTYQSPSVTVTSTRANDMQSPVSFSEISKEEIKQSYGNKDLPYLLDNLPSVLLYNENGNGIGYTNLTIRGFDQRRIALLINGIPQNDPEDHNAYWINTSDLQSSLSDIQVQRGAGLVNYGAAAIAGSINLTTKNLTDKPEVNLYTGYGFQEFGGEGRTIHNSSRYKLEYSSGLIDEKYSIYGKLGRIQSAGYRDESWAQLNSWFVSVVRFDDNLTSQVNVYGGSQRDALAYTGLPKGYVGDLNLRRRNYSDWGYDSDLKTLAWSANRRPQEIEEFSSPHYELLNDYTINEKMSIKSALFFFTGTGFFDYDASWADADMLRINSQYGFEDGLDITGTIFRAFVGNRQYGWIPRFIYDNEMGELTLGAELRFHRSEHYGKVGFAEGLPSGFDPAYKIYEYNGRRDIFSVFARQIWELSDELKLNFEGQIVNHTYAIGNEKNGGQAVIFPQANGGLAGGSELFNINYTFFNPRIGASYSPSENNNFYALAALTSREPRMRNLYAPGDTYFGAAPLFNSNINNGTQIYDFNSPIVKPEQMLNIELGWRNKSDIHRFEINYYLLDYSNELVKNGTLDIFGAPVDGNAPRTIHTGLELSGSLALISYDAHSLVIGGNTTLSSNLIKEFEYFNSYSVDGNSVVDTINLSGNRIALFPDAMLSAFVNYNWGAWNSSLTFKYVGSMKTDNFGNLLTENQNLAQKVGYSDNTMPAYHYFNFNTSFELKEILDFQSIRIHFQINNLTNQLFASYAVGSQYFVAAERSYFVGIELGI